MRTLLLMCFMIILVTTSKSQITPTEIKPTKVYVDRIESQNFKKLTQWLNSTLIEYSLPEYFDKTHSFVNKIGQKQGDFDENDWYSNSLKLLNLLAIESEGENYIIPASNIMYINCWGDETGVLSGELNYLGIKMKDFKSESRPLANALLTDIALNGSVRGNEFYTCFLLKFSHLIKKSVKNCIVEVNCDNTTKINYSLFWERGLTIVSKLEHGKSDQEDILPMKCVEVRRRISGSLNEKKFNDDYSILEDSISSLLETYLINEYGDDQVHFISSSPPEYQVYYVKDVITKPDNFWESIEISFLSFRIENSELIWRGSFDGDHYKRISKYVPSSKVFNSGSDNLGVNYSTQLRAYGENCMNKVLNQLIESPILDKYK